MPDCSQPIFSLRLPRFVLLLFVRLFALGKQHNGRLCMQGLTPTRDTSQFISSCVPSDHILFLLLPRE